MNKNEPFTRIPKEAWENLSEPDPQLFDKCLSCGGRNVRALSSYAMMLTDPNRFVNENTFMIPNVTWGYLQCDDCEERQAQESARAPKPWWKRFFGSTS